MFASNSREACAERALVLIALGIDAQLTFDARRYTLRVAPENAERARAELAQYELEIERRARPPEPAASRPARRPEAWLGCALYALTLLAVAIAIGRGIGRLDAFDVGELNGARVQAGQWWRAWTALTLHLDAEHLLANLAGGIWFGYLAAGELGAGHAWFLGVSAAGAANLLEALLGPASHRAVGASTLVFSLLGLLSAHAWRMRSGLTQRWALQWAPLVGGLMLLAWTGTGGNDVSQAIAQTGGQVDVVAHLLGFAAGALLGWLAALPRLAARVARVPQWLSGLAAVGWMGIAWGLALHS